MRQGRNQGTKIYPASKRHEVWRKIVPVIKTLTNPMLGHHFSVLKERKKR